MRSNDNGAPSSENDRSAALAAALIAARDSPAVAQASTRMTSAARERLVAAMMTERPVLRPIKKAVPRGGPTELSIQLQSYAKLVRR